MSKIFLMIHHTVKFQLLTARFEAIYIENRLLIEIFECISVKMCYTRLHK